MMFLDGCLFFEKDGVVKVFKSLNFYGGGLVKDVVMFYFVVLGVVDC